MAGGKDHCQGRTTFEALNFIEASEAVRPGHIGGGGGHRTHVRKPSATGIYIHSRLSFALAAPPSNRLVVRAASSLKSRPSLKSGAWGQSPEYDVRTRTPLTRSGGR